MRDKHKLLKKQIKITIQNLKKKLGESILKMYVLLGIMLIKIVSILKFSQNVFFGTPFYLSKIMFQFKVIHLRYLVVLIILLLISYNYL